MAATQPMPADDAGSYGDDTDTGAGAGGQPEDDGGYSIEIRVSGNKDISVCVEGGADEAAEDQGGAGGEAGEEDDSGGGMSKYTPCKSIKEALTLALEIFRNDGEMPGQADDQFQQGFEGASS
jgi:hypothetical protein